MKEIFDRSTGAILFKSIPNDPTDARLKELSDAVNKLNKEISSLKKEIKDLKAGK